MECWRSLAEARQERIKLLSAAYAVFHECVLQALSIEEDRKPKRRAIRHLYLLLMQVSYNLF